MQMEVDILIRRNSRLVSILSEKKRQRVKLKPYSLNMEAKMLTELNTIASKVCLLVIQANR